MTMTALFWNLVGLTWLVALFWTAWWIGGKLTPMWNWIGDRLYGPAEQPDQTLADLSQPTRE